MTGIDGMRIPYRWLVLSVLAFPLCLPDAASAQEEVASAIRRYRDREVSTGYYEQYEVKPRRMVPLIEIPGVARGIFPYTPTAAEVRIRTRLVDSHRGIKFYKDLRCQYCHVNEAKDIHTVRANLTCRQCHGGEPISSIQHFYSLMNPIRKHAYVCAKCHEGATASYGAYIIHEPPPGRPETRAEFPILYYSYWFMAFLFIGVMAFFVPHSLLMAVRELFRKKEKSGN